MAPTLEIAQRLLAEAVAADPRGRAGVAEKLGYGRALISRVLNPEDRCPMSQKLAASIVEIYHLGASGASCPATGALMPRSECHRINSGRAPTHNPESMRIWKKCQSCPAKPKGDKA